MRGDGWMRNLLWTRYAQLFKPGQAVLDVGCGTGIDAAYLAGIGLRVVGIDASPAMIARAQARIVNGSFNDRIELRVLEVAAIASLGEGVFDGIISAFAGLSAVEPLEGFAAEAAGLLKPRGTMLLHLLNRWSLWEWMGLVKVGRWREASGLSHTTQRNFPIGGRPVGHRLYHAEEAYARFFAGHFRLRRAYGLGIVRPPHTLRRVPASIVTQLERAEPVVRTRRPFMNWGRFFVLELEKR